MSLEVAYFDGFNTRLSVLRAFVCTEQQPCTRCLINMGRERSSSGQQLGIGRPPTSARPVEELESASDPDDEERG